MRAKRLTALAAFTAIVSLARAPTPLQAQAYVADEYAVKAAYVLLFARYVDWPAAAFRTPDAPLIVTVLGEDPFGAMLEETFDAHTVHGRAIAVHRTRTLETPPPHVVIFGKASEAEHRAWLDELSHAPVLTIAEEDGILRHQTVLTFITRLRRDEARVRFDVNLDAMHRAGLQIDSQMLAAANEILRGAEALDAGAHP